MTRTVSTIATAPVKGFALTFPQRVVVGADGVAHNRRFALLDAQGDRLRSARHAWPCTVVADFDESGLLTMRFPDGAAVAARVELGDAVRFDYHGAPVDAHVVVGPWTERLAALAGIPLQLVMLDRGGQVQGQPVTLVSAASLQKIAEEAGETVDPRRFRMLFHVDGCAPHEEGDWLGLRIRVGGTVVRVVERVERCVVTTRDPETGARDLDTLAILERYRGAIGFGVRA
jgi:uncharacterized protein